MKKEISPVVAIVLILVIVAAIGGVYVWRTGSVAGSGASGPPPLPPSVGQQLGEAMKNAGQQQGSTAPPSQAGPTPVLGAGGVPPSPPPGR